MPTSTLGIAIIILAAFWILWRLMDFLTGWHFEYYEPKPIQWVCDQLSNLKNEITRSDSEDERLQNGIREEKKLLKQRAKAEKKRQKELAKNRFERNEILDLE